MYWCPATHRMGHRPAVQATPGSWLGWGISGLIQDLLNQNLHFNKISRQFLCTLKLKKQCFRAALPSKNIECITYIVGVFVESIKGKMEQVKLILLLLIHFTSNTEHIIILIRVNKK